MKKLILFSLLFLAACQEGPQTHDMNLSDTTDTHGIVRGTEVATTNEISKMVFSLFSVDPAKTVVRQEGNTTYTQEFGLQCTTSPITKRIAITAAHCVENLDLNHRVEIKQADGKKFVDKVIAFRIHPGYTDGRSEHKIDMALLLLEKDLPEGTIYPVLPNEIENLDLKEITSSGFGKITGETMRDGKSGILRTAKTKVSKYRHGADIFEIDQYEGSGICSGDSGGPAYQTSGGHYKLVGIAAAVSFYIFPGDENPDKCKGMGQYINVQNQLGWIKATAQELLAN